MSETKKVRKAVIAAAGFGTRFLPQTKAMPKEMLPLVDKPIIQYIVEELVGAGIEDIVIVTGYHKRSIEDHFDHTSMELRSNLKQGGKHEILDEIRKISRLANFAYIRQKGPYGNATPILDAEHLIGDEPFIYTFADDFVRATPSRFTQLIDTHNTYGGNVLTCVTRDYPEDFKRYGYISGTNITDDVVDMQTFIEKPGTREASPSTLAAVSGYLFEPTLFTYLHEELAKLEEGKEFIFQPALERMAHDGHHVYGRNIVGGTFYDTGNKLEYLKTVFDFALENDDIGPELQEYLRKKLQ